MRFHIVYSPDTKGNSSGLYSQGIWIVLEKFGFLDYELLTWDAYRQRAAEGPAHVAIITAPVTRGLSDEDLDWLAGRECLVVLEGPWSADTDDWFGVQIDRSVADSHSAHLVLEDSVLVEKLTEHLLGIKGPSNMGGFVSQYSLYVRDRSRAERKQSQHVSAHAGCNSQAQIPSWCVPETSIDAPAECEVILQWREGNTPCGILMFRKGNLLVTSFELLSYLTQDYTIEDMHHEYSFSYDRYPLELILLWTLLDGLQETYSGLEAPGNMMAMRVGPWPNGRQSVLTVRHDVDRTLWGLKFRSLLNRERKAGAGVSCYFLSSKVKRKLVKIAEACGAEVAYHSMNLEPDGDKEIQAIEKVSTQKVCGSTVHGTAGIYGWRGAANWEIASRRGFDYCEHLSSMRYFPSRVFKLDQCQQIEPYRFVALPRHMSFDKNMKENYADVLPGVVEAMARNEMPVVLLNHPDIHGQELSAFLKANYPIDALGWTALEMARWWRKTHFRENLSYEIISADDGELVVEFQASQDIDGLTVELPTSVRPLACHLDNQLIGEDQCKPFHISALCSNGFRVFFDLKAGLSRLSIRWEIGSGTEDAPQPDVDAVLSHHEKEILDWFAQSGNGEVTDANRITAKFNSLDAPNRTGLLFAPLAERMRQKKYFSLLDVGCGFGGIALSLALDFPHANITAVDISPRFYSAAENTCKKKSVGNLQFASTSILDLSDADRYDFVLLSGMVNYLTSAADLRQGCENAWRALRSGGYIVLHTPHFWTWREPFTKIPFLQLFPRKVQNWLVGKLGRRSTMADIRLPSLRELKRIFSSLGAGEITYKPCELHRRFRLPHLTMWIRK